jgi:perosamine synthetase
MKSPDARSSSIPVFRPSVSEAEIEAVTATLRSGWLGCGPKTKEFEREFQHFTGAAHAVATNSGTGALMAALAALDIGPGDEVIIPSFTWPSIFQVVRTLGATPVFADIEPAWLTLDPGDVERRVSSRTRGIVAVHHGGHTADLEGLQSVADQHGLWLIDDAAHACGTVAADGRRIGVHTKMSCFSFNAVKNLCAGDGGMVTTADEVLAQKVRRFVSLGLDRDTFSRYGPGSERNPDRWRFELAGSGQRLHMNDITASLGLAQLARLDLLNRRRAELAARYHEVFAGVNTLRLVGARPGTSPSWHMMTVLLDQRDRFIEKMADEGIAVGVHYRPIHGFEIARPWAARLPVTESIAARTATLPLFPDLSGRDQERVIEATVTFARSLRPRKVARA